MTSPLVSNPRYVSLQMTAFYTMKFTLLLTLLPCNTILTLHSWAIKWQTQFNSKKCHILSLTRKRYKPIVIYHLGSEVLSQVDSYPYLGVTVASDLCWHIHVSTICTKATRVLNFVRRNVYNCSPEAKALAYLSPVRPHLEYAAAAWDPHLTKDVKQLEGVQRRAARFACHNYHFASSVSALLDRLQWPLLSSRRKNCRLTLFYKAVHNQIAIPLIHLQKPIRTTRQSNSTTFTAIPTRSDVYKFSFLPRTVTDWNSLPQEVRDKPTFLSFRHALAAPSPCC